jgi:hypothetical protein
MTIDVVVAARSGVRLWDLDRRHLKRYRIGCCVLLLCVNSVHVQLEKRVSHSTVRGVVFEHVHGLPTGVVVSHAGNLHGVEWAGRQMHAGRWQGRQKTARENTVKN